MPKIILVEVGISCPDSLITSPNLGTIKRNIIVITIIKTPTTKPG
jgi:hypothetical protein